MEHARTAANVSLDDVICIACVLPARAKYFRILPAAQVDSH